MAKKTSDLLTAADLARCCRVDMKTIHNWASRGELAHFRTPGRHLRFHREDVLDFLRKYGYPVPDWLLRGPPRVVLAGPPAQTEPCVGALRGIVDVTCSDHLLRVLIDAGASPPDAVVLFAPPPSEGGLGGTPLLPLVAALQSHARTQRVRLITVGPQLSNPLPLGASAHFESVDGETLVESLSRILGLNPVKS